MKQFKNGEKYTSKLSHKKNKNRIDNSFKIKKIIYKNVYFYL